MAGPNRRIDGDLVSHATLFRRHHGRLLATVEPRIPRDLRSIIDAEDVVQEALEAAFRDLDRFDDRGEGAFWAWLTRIAENRLAAAIKAARRIKRGGGRCKVDPAVGSSTISDPLGRLRPLSRTASRSAARRELPRVITAAMEAHLSDDEQGVVEMRHLKHLDWSEIAAELRRTPDAVRAIDHRALKKLKAVLGRLSRLMSG